jgi:molybdopterin synthase catalytic subunit
MGPEHSVAQEPALSAGATVSAAVVENAIDPASLVNRVASHSSGATALFLGTVRNVHEGRAVMGIEYHAYKPMAERELATIAAAAAARFAAQGVVVEHRVGRLELGEISVGIAVSHAHRAPAFDAAREIIEEIKRRVPIWKRELYVDGTRQWVDPTRAAGATVGGHSESPQ